MSLDVALHPDGRAGTGSAAAGAPAPVLELLRDAPAGTVLSLNVPDRPPRARRELRDARLARGGAVQAGVDDVGDGDLHLGEVEVGDEPEEGTDSALLPAGHPTLTALRSVGGGRRRTRAEEAGVAEDADDRYVPAVCRPH